MEETLPRFPQEGFFFAEQRPVRKMNLQRKAGTPDPFFSPKAARPEGWTVLQAGRREILIACVPSGTLPPATQEAVPDHLGKDNSPGKNTKTKTTNNIMESQVSNTKMTCPICGAHFALPEHEHLAAGIAIGKDSGLGEIHPALEKEGIPPAGSRNKPMSRLEALKAAGLSLIHI